MQTAFGQVNYSNCPWHSASRSNALHLCTNGSAKATSAGVAVQTIRRRIIRRYTLSTMSRRRCSVYRTAFSNVRDVPIDGDKDGDSDGIKTLPPERLSSCAENAGSFTLPSVTEAT